jgi:subtilase family serine protease
MRLARRAAMTKRLVLLAVTAALASLTDVKAQRAGEMPRAGAPAQRVIAADRHDRSQTLKDMAAMPPAGEQVKGREHRWRRVSRHAADLLPDPVVQNVPAVVTIPTPGRSFEGLGNLNGVLPPDTNGDVGPNHFVQSVNLSFAIYSKGSPASAPTLLYGPAPSNTVWSGFGGPCETRNDGDPIVRYDHLADRWVISQLAIPNSFLGLLFGPFYECIAVSATADPLGSYHRYQFSFDKLNDYPKLGVWPDAYYMTMNQFTSVSLQWAGQGVVAFDRAKMIAGLPATAVYYDLAPVDLNLGGMMPADLDGPPPPSGSPAFFAQVDDDAWGVTPDQLQLWKFHTDWTTPSLSSFTRAALLPTEPFDSDLCGYARNCIPQPGTGAKIDALSDRLMYRLQYRNFGTHESLVVNHTVDADGTDHAGIRWYEVRNPGSSPVIHQQGTYAPDQDHRWMGSAAMDNAGNIALGFSVSGAFTSPSVRYAGRLAADSLNTMTLGETDLIAGTGSQLHTSGRWGDYSTLVVDPSDDCTFWYTQEYYAVTSESGWQTRIGSFAFPSCSAAPSEGPIVTVVASPSTATEAAGAAAVFTVTRTGDTALPLTVPYGVGGTATPGADYVALTGTLDIPAGDIAATISVTPVDDALVEPLETVTVVLKADPTYTLGLASATATIVSDDLLPDLVVTTLTLTGPAVAGVGTSLAISDVTKNQGQGPAEASTTTFYLSANSTVDAADVVLGSRAVPALVPGGSDAVSTVLVVPAGTATRVYFLLAKADGAGLLAEAVETNNVRAGPSIAVGPDLIVAALTAPPATVSGSSITVADTVTNRGAGSAAASTTSFYLSTNVSFDTADVPLGGRDAGPLAAGASGSGPTVLVIPADTAAGLHYVIAKADALATVVETQEGNNNRASAVIRVGPDLIESGVQLVAVSGAGSLVTVSDTVRNQGAGPAAASTTQLYLSKNGSLDAADPLLGSRAVPELAPTGAHTGTTTVLIPADTVPGTYYMLARADALGVVAEATETNNVAYSTTRIGPDLIVAALTVPLSGVAGTTIAATVAIRNTGGADAPESVVRLYLSTNQTYDGADVLMGSRSVPVVGAGATDSATAVLTLPAVIAAGTYYVIAVADADRTVTETIETNNTRLVVLRITGT